MPIFSKNNTIVWTIDINENPYHFKNIPFEINNMYIEAYHSTNISLDFLERFIRIKQLTIYGVTTTQLPKLPDNLDYLYIENTRIQTIDNLPCSIRWIMFRNNNITNLAIPHGIRHFDAHQDTISRLSLYNCIHIQRFRCKECNIDRIEHIPYRCSNPYNTEMKIINCSTPYTQTILNDPYRIFIHIQDTNKQLEIESMSIFQNISISTKENLCKNPTKINILDNANPIGRAFTLASNVSRRCTEFVFTNDL